MIDGFKIEIDYGLINSSYEHFKQNRNVGTTVNGVEYFSYSIDGLDFYSNEYKSSLSVTGSLPNYINGNNYEPIKFNQIEKGITKLCDYFNNDILDSQVKNYEFGCPILLNKPFANYADLMREMRSKTGKTKMERQPYAHGLEYYNTTRKFKFYDKIKRMEADGSGRYLPREIKGKNIARLELRHNRPKGIRLSDFLDKDFHSKNVTKLLSYYNSIEKERYIMEDRSLKDFKSFENYMLFKFYASMDYQKRNDVIDQMLQEINETQFDNRMQKSRSRKKLNQLEAITSDARRNNPLILELDEKLSLGIDNCYKE